ncbi:MAG: endo-1,4-beta-xylanase [Mediterranea sp.]|jgi:endo-1,4-beta-xylanase|nr:endo-1,4-beta-xylanase [Mediterranea sp.]
MKNKTKKMKRIHILLLLPMMIVACLNELSPAMPDEEETTLKKAVGHHFLIGTTLNNAIVNGRDPASDRVVKRHFNAITHGYAMKFAMLHPAEGRYLFDESDAFVRYGEQNGMTVIGHCLVWHKQLPDWVVRDKDGNLVTPEALKARMREHISTVVGRYRGRVKGWDVVNEAFLEDGSYRQSPYYEILGEEFIPLAFQYAHEADPDAELYYNDGNMAVTKRREAVVRLIGQLKARGLRIDAVGMQAHVSMNFPKVENFEKSIQAFADAGVKVMITEWDMTALPTTDTGSDGRPLTPEELDPYPEKMPDSASQAWNARMKQFFDLFVKYSDVVTRVTVWGVSDIDSWLNDFPFPGRTDYPLLFDREYQPKTFVREILGEE